MRVANRKLIMVGAFPPPVHGMAAVNAAIRDYFLSVGISPIVVDISSNSLNRSLFSRLRRFPKVIYGLGKLFLRENIQHATLYMSLSGGLGQAYELLFLLLARQRKMRVYLHHHSFAYLERKNILTKTLVLLAGKSATHITLSGNMAEKLKASYPFANHIRSLSNAVFLSGKKPSVVVSRTALRTIGFIGNISAEKGVMDFLKLVEAYEASGLSIRAILAGPCQDIRTERMIRKQLKNLFTIEYIGPQYGENKKLFYSAIDVLIFPTRYANEAEPVTIHEAMRHAVPVIAYNRGSISEIIDQGSGLIIDSGCQFADIALKKLEQWIDYPDTYARASQSALKKYNDTFSDNSNRWQSLATEIGSALTQSSSMGVTSLKD